MIENEQRLGYMNFAEFTALEAPAKDQDAIAKIWNKLQDTNAEYQANLDEYNSNKLSDPSGLYSVSPPAPQSDEMPFMFESGNSSSTKSGRSEFDPTAFEPETTFINLDAIANMVAKKKGSTKVHFGIISKEVLGQLLQSASKKTEQ